MLCKLLKLPPLKKKLAWRKNIEELEEIRKGEEGLSWDHIASMCFFHFKSLKNQYKMPTSHV